MHPLTMKTSVTSRALINLDALRHNLARVKQAAPETKILSVIKANAYGHGVLEVAEALSASDAFAVARLDEALILQKYLLEHEIKKNIILLEGVFCAEDYQQCKAQKLIPVIHSLEQFQWLYESGCTLDYWLKIDTGMHRLGLSENDLEYLINQYQQIDADYLPAVVISHFSCADEVENPTNQTQIKQFNQQSDLLACLKGVDSFQKSMANSAAILSHSDAHFDWVRPGIMLYGISPFETATPSRNGLDENLKPVMTLSSELISIKNLKKGDCIGYGASWCCPEDMTIGVIAIGYGDGYPRHAPSGTPVLINNMEVPLVGRVSMDMITVDLGALEKNQIPFQMGDRAILWGKGLPIEKISQKAGTIAYELLCQITQRVSFEYE